MGGHNNVLVAIFYGGHIAPVAIFTGGHIAQVFIGLADVGSSQEDRHETFKLYLNTCFSAILVCYL